MRSRVVLVLAVAAIALGSVLLVPNAYARLGRTAALAGNGNAEPTAQAKPLPAPPPPTLAAAPININLGKGTFFSWALLDRETGTISGSANSATSTNSTESMIKVWIVSDYLRRTAEQGKQPSKTRLAQASTAIRDSNDDAAGALYRAGGGTVVTKRMISMCGLVSTRLGTVPGYVGWWSFTQMSAQDAVRLGECVKSGKAAGPEWTDWVLTEMTKVRGTTAKKDQQEKQGGGRWGIIDGLPKEILTQGPVSIKNGWTPLNYDGKWHVNCLAVTDGWVLAVQVRYPIKRGLDYGATVCRRVATQLVAPRPGAALKVPQPLVGQKTPSPNPARG